MMALPYENCTSGDRALANVQKMLRDFGVQSFGSMIDYETGELIVQFRYQDRQIDVRASMNGYAEAWRKEHPYSSRMKGSKSDWEQKSFSIAGVAVYSILRDWLKGQMTAIETGMLTFESAFMPHFLLPNGQRVIDRIKADNLIPSLGHD